jgi:flagellar biosynthesis protein FliQ
MLNLTDQALIQTFQLLLYFSALILVPCVLVSLLGSWLQRLAGTNDLTLTFALRVVVVGLVVFIFGAAFYSALQELLRLVLGA